MSDHSSSHSGGSGSGGGGGVEVDDHTIFQRSLSDFGTTAKDLESKLASGLQRLEADFANVDECVTAHASLTEQYTRLQRMLQQLKENEKPSDEQKR